jgi:hypothetical protein
MGQLGGGVQALLLFASVLGFFFVMVGVVWIGLVFVGDRRSHAGGSRRKTNNQPHRRVVDGEETQAP